MGVQNKPTVVLQGKCATTKGRNGSAATREDANLLSDVFDLLQSQERTERRILFRFSKSKNKAP